MFLKRHKLAVICLSFLHVVGLAAPLQTENEFSLKEKVEKTVQEVKEGVKQESKSVRADVKHLAEKVEDKVQKGKQRIADYLDSKKSLVKKINGYLEDPMLVGQYACVRLILGLGIAGTISKWVPKGMSWALERLALKKYITEFFERVKAEDRNAVRNALKGVFGLCFALGLYARDARANLKNLTLMWTLLGILEELTCEDLLMIEKAAFEVKKEALFHGKGVENIQASLQALSVR